MKRIPAEERVGCTFGNLEVLSITGQDDDSRKIAACYCHRCGRVRNIRLDHVVRGLIKACGCLCNHKVRPRPKCGQSNSHERRAWRHLISRCRNTRDRMYPNYGGRGINVCQRWLNSFEAFLEDMGPRPSPGHSIDRIDNDGNYEPGNCRWTTRVEQARNKTSTRYITAGEATRSLAEWSELTGISRGTISNRLALGWAPELALTRSPIPRSESLRRARSARRDREVITDRHQRVPAWVLVALRELARERRVA